MAKKNIFSNILNTAGQAAGAVGQGLWLRSAPGAAYEQGRLNREASQMNQRQLDEQELKNYFDIASQITKRVETLPQEQQAAALDNLSKFFSDPERRKLITEMPITQPPAGMKPAISKVGETTYYSPETMAAAKGTRGTSPLNYFNYVAYANQLSKMKLQAAMLPDDSPEKTAIETDIATRENILQSMLGELQNKPTTPAPTGGNDWLGMGGGDYANMSPEEKQAFLAQYAGETEPSATGEPPAGTPEFVTRPAVRQQAQPELPEAPTPTTPTPTAQKYGMKESVVVGGKKYTVGGIITAGGKRYIVDHIENGKPKLLPAK